MSIRVEASMSAEHTNQPTNQRAAPIYIVALAGRYHQ